MTNHVSAVWRRDNDDGGCSVGVQVGDENITLRSWVGPLTRGFGEPGDLVDALATALWPSKWPAVINKVEREHELRGWIVVLYSTEACLQDESTRCLQGSVYGPYTTHEEAKQLASRFPEGFNAHVLMLNGDR